MKKVVVYSLVLCFAAPFSLHAEKKVGVDPKLEKKTLDSLYSITVLVVNADNLYPLNNLAQANSDIENIIKTLTSFKEYDYLRKAVVYLKTAQKEIGDAYKITGGAQEDFMTRNFHIQKAQNALFKAGQTIKFGEIPEYKSNAEELKDFYNRVTTAKKSLNYAIAKLKLKKPEIKEVIKIVQEVKDLMRPFLKYQVINRVDIFLTTFVLKHLNQAIEDKDRLEKERNIQNSILSMVYATEFLDDAEKDLKELNNK